MKKILLATTVLGMSAGFASAEVAVSGSARMGVVSTDGDSVFSSRVRMTFSGSGTTDGGLAFGGKFDAHNSQGANAGTSGSVFISGAFGKISMGDVDGGDAAAVGQLASVGYTGLGSTNSINYASDGFDLFGIPADIKSNSSVAWGYVDSEYVILTDEQLANNLPVYYDFANETSTEVTGGSPAKVLYTYSAGGFTLNASASQIANGSGNNSFGVGGAFTTGGLTVAAGYGSNEFGFVTTNEVSVEYPGTFAGTFYDQTGPQSRTTVSNGEVTDTSLSVTYVLGDTTVKAIYQDKQIDATAQFAYFNTVDPTLDDNTWIDNGPAEDVSAEATSMGLSVVHKIGVLTLTAFGVSTDISTDMLPGDASDVTLTRTGLGVAYDLGGGATVKGGVVRAEAAALDGDYELESVSKNVYDLGVNFSF